MSDNFVPKNPSEFFCDYCTYNTQYKRDYEKHLLTAKHLRMTKNDKEAYNCPEKFVCHCGKKYKYRQGLFSHRKQCIKEDDNSTTLLKELPNDMLNTNVILELINQNKEFKDLLMLQSKQLMEQANQQSKSKDELINKLIEREPANNNINTINGNVTNNNQKFNLNFFLNETCKDAMTIQEFLDSIRITFDDLLLIGNAGFVNGVSDILIKQLRDLDVSKRPIHCTDSKRDTIYLKENAAWNKDDKDKTKLKQILEKIEYRNVVALRDWCNENPDAKVNNTPNNILKDKIYFQTLQGDDKTRDKIIKNISKEVMVEKE
jgi:hypothetical protein